MTDDRKAAIFAEIREITESQYMKPGDITVSEYRDVRRITQAKAEIEIKRAVAQGLLVDAGLLINPRNGRRQRVYRRASNGHQGDANRD